MRILPYISIFYSIDIWSIKPKLIWLLIPQNMFPFAYFSFPPFISLILILSLAPIFFQSIFYLSSVILLHCEFLTHILYIFVILCLANNAFIHSTLPRYWGPGIQLLTRRSSPFTQSIFWSKEESDREHNWKSICTANHIAIKHNEADL